MKIIDIYRTIKKTGNFLSLVAIADTHILCELSKAALEGRKPNFKDPKDAEDPAYQPLDYEAYQYLRYCIDEVVSMPEYYGEPLAVTGGDLTELEKSSTRKVMRALRKNDCRGQDTLHKSILNDHVIPKIKTLLKGMRLIGGVAGNHMVEFHSGTGPRNSEEYIIRRLGGEYCGEGMLLINLHVNYGAQRVCKKILITHGAKGGTKTAIINELKRLHELCGEIALVIKCHAHDPMTAFYARYKMPDKAGTKCKKVETLVMCMGSTRDGIKEGYDDYSERFAYAPCASRFPIAVFHACKLMENNRSLDIKIRPITM